MTEQTQQPNGSGTSSSEGAGPSAATGAQQEQKRAERSGQELIDELARLGASLAEAARAAWASDERKKLESDLKASLVALATGVEQGLRRACESSQTKEMFHKAEDAAESLHARVRSSQSAHEVASGLAKGLRVLAEQIDKMAEELQRKAPADAAKDTGQAATSTKPGGTQDIPIERL
ncbi:MAG: hypothetical protein R3C14_37600 [Caldilineaceae bacterium]